MNLILGVCVGAVIGWVAFKFLNGSNERGLRSSLLIAILGGGVGAQLAVMFGATDVTDGHFNLVSLIVSAAGAAAGLFAAKVIADRDRA